LVIFLGLCNSCCLTFQFVINDMLQKNEIYNMPDIMIMENEAAKVYMNSNIAQVRIVEMSSL